MYIKAVSFIIIVMLLQIFLGSIFVDGSAVSFFARFFIKIVGGAAAVGKELAGEAAVQVVASGVNDKGGSNPNLPKYDQAYQRVEKDDQTGTGLTEAQLDYLQSVVQGIRAYPMPYQQVFCNAYPGQLTTPQCIFVICCVEDPRIRAYSSTREIGRDCILEIMVINIFISSAYYEQQFCYGGNESSSACEFIKCAYNRRERGYQYAKDIGMTCYDNINSNQTLNKGLQAPPPKSGTTSTFPSSVETAATSAAIITTSLVLISWFL